MQSCLLWRHCNAMVVLAATVNKKLFVFSVIWENICLPMWYERFSWSLDFGDKMAEFTHPVLKIWRSQKLIVIQIQLMNIRIWECKYYCLHLVPKFGDVHNPPNWRLHPTDEVRKESSEYDITRKLLSLSLDLFFEIWLFPVTFLLVFFYRHLLPLLFFWLGCYCSMWLYFSPGN